MENNTPSVRTHTVELGPELSLTLSEAGGGRPVLILHGGGGPFTVAPIATHLARTMHTITPTHPGWNGTPRPAWFSGIDDLALAYLHYLEDRDLRDVLVIGSSIGGWLAAEMAVRDQARRISGLVLVNAGGVQVQGEACRDFFALSPREVAEYSFAHPERFYVDPATLPAEQVAMRRANGETLRVFAGGSQMSDPKLLRRLQRVRLPALVLWGEQDRIFPLAYGRAYAAAFADASFQTIADAGHLPHLEQPAATLAAIDAYANAGRSSR